MSFFTVLTEAIRYFEQHGYSSETALADWTRKIRESAIDSLITEESLQRLLTSNLRMEYARLIERGAILQMHKGLDRFTLDKLAPQLRSELDRRLAASARLIKLNRQAAIERTVQRFSGWASSVPAGGSNVIDKLDTKDNIRKELGKLPFEERRVAIDQGHKMIAALNDIIATDGGAIAAEWHSHWRRAGYNYRKDHKERDKRIYLIRGSWASEGGLVKSGDAGYLDEITQPGEEVFCSCYVTYIYSLRKLPLDMLTNKGKEAIQ